MDSKEKAKDARLRREYHITLEERTVIDKYQNHVCAICKKPPKNLSLSIDHDHHTGQIRGLLCWNCNRMLKMYGEVAKAVVDYLVFPPAELALGRPRYTAPGRVGTKKRAKLLKTMSKIQQGVNVKKKK